jgi:hypothetical protein
MAGEFTIRLVARNEGIEYREGLETYRFNISLVGGQWRVYLPGTKGEFFEVHELSTQERDRILPRIEAYLGSRRYFVLVGPTFPVTFVPEEPPSESLVRSRRRAAEFWQKRKLEANKEKGGR